MAGAWTLVILGGSMALSILCSALALWLACNGVLAQPVPFARGVGASAILLGVWTAGGVLILGAVRLVPGAPGPIVALLALASIPAATWWVYNRLFRIGRPAALAVTLLYCMLYAGAQWGSSALLRTCVMRGYLINSEGMAPTLRPGDRVLALLHAPPARWSPVVYRFPSGMPVVQRVVGLPGERVHIDASGLSINGRHVEPPRGVPSPAPAPGAVHAVTGEVTLPPDEYFLVGDNHDASLDSRFFAASPGAPAYAATASPFGVPRSAIIGVAGLRFWPFPRLEILDP